MRYFVVTDKDGPIAVVCHDYRRGSFTCRSVLESFSSVFDSCAVNSEMKYTRESQGLRVAAYSAQEHEWIDDVLSRVFECSSDWGISVAGESSGSDITIDDLVAEYLV